MKRYDVGDVVRVTATFTDSGGGAVDPSTITFQYKPVIDTTSTLIYGVNSIVRLSAGIYYTDLAVNSSGVWTYRWNGLAANAAAEENQFEVRFRNVG